MLFYFKNIFIDDWMLLVGEIYMKNLIIGICILIIILGIILFAVYIKKMLKGKCCEGCNGCNQKENCSNIDKKI